MVLGLTSHGPVGCRAGICHTAGPRLASIRLDSGLAHRCGALGTSPGAAPRCRGHAAAVACAVQCRLLYGILCWSTPILSQCAWRFDGHMGPKGAAGWGAWGGDWGGMGRPKQGSLYGENPFGMWAKKGVIPPFATTLERSTPNQPQVETSLGSISCAGQIRIAFIGSRPKSLILLCS